MMNKIVIKPGVALFKQRIAILLILAVFCGCHQGGKEDVKEAKDLKPLKRLNARAYPLFTDSSNLKGLEISINQSLSYFKKVSLERKYHYGEDIYTAGHMITSLETFRGFLAKTPSSTELNNFIKSLFIVYEARGNPEGKVLFTGYYEPTYEGRLKKSEVYPYPAYSKPDDLLEIDLSRFSEKYKGHKRLKARVNEKTRRVIPYYSREEINAIDSFHKRSAPVVWMKSRIDRFFLEVQGSGRIALDKGGILRIHYAGSNGRPYRSIGRYLIKKNEITKEKMSMQAIRSWLLKHPERMDEVLHYNESFVFFRKEKGGPYGSLGVQVTPLRSIATDSKLFPKGALCFMETRLPDRSNLKPLKEWKKASVFVLNQDTGGAIKGTARADLFCGNDSYAEFTAGHKNQWGRLFFLVLNPNH